MKDVVLSRISDHSAAVAVIGMGYVGLPLAVAFAEHGFRVVGVDVDARKVALLNAGESYVEDISSTRLAPLVAAGAFRAIAGYDVLSQCDAVIICVPTPLGKTHDPDMRYVIAAGKSVAQHIHPGMLVVLESTTYPGTTDELLRPLLERGGLVAGKDFFLAFSPERIDPGRTDYVVENTPKVVGGLTPVCCEVAVALYSQAIQTVVPVSSTQTAEMVKLLENTFRAVNIALVNEVAIMCDKLGLDVWEVIDAAATKPYGFARFTPGPGVGGHCIPLDPHYLSWKLKTLNYTARFIQLAGEINSEMPRHWVTKVQDALNDAGKAVKGSRILVLGVAYKKDVGDVRESPALDIIELLRGKGALVSYHDPYVPAISHNGYGLVGEPDLAQAIAVADCVLVVTDHSAYDWPAIHRQAKLLVDTRRTSDGGDSPQRTQRTQRG
ncbi:MAG TPA: nucleotide sugar dehydrogenase [Anaerolineae bacterium]|nr:nucleotide sugar dehydrogenase [Anaerolineae bacterium]HOQ98397.1 nucleotide sugar dehydrogenase [Anaerolineae bacterium]HPL26491.1 nucleotide sugar dehydrogenase [Anaerolineae bacterium]